MPKRCQEIRQIKIGGAIQLFFTVFWRENQDVYKRQMVDDPELINEAGRELILAHLIKGQKEKFDYILIDCPPSLCLLYTSDDEEVKVSIAQYRGGRDAAISYTFDDGLLEQYTLVFPELEKKMCIRDSYRQSSVIDDFKIHSKFLSKK